MRIVVIGPSELNEECGVIGICYSKWFGRKSKIPTLSSKNVEQKPKPVYIINELISGKLPEEINSSLDLRHVSLEEFEGRI